MGAVTGKGLADLIREQFGVRWTVLAMLALLVANTGVTISEFIGVAASVQVLANDPHTPLIYLVVPLSGLALWWLVTRGTYRRVEKVFLLISLGFLAYIPAAFAAHPNWQMVGQQVVAPHLNIDANYWPTTAALVGTTLSPYMLFYIQSAVADKGIRADEYVYEKVDVYSSTIFSNIISAFIKSLRGGDPDAALYWMTRMLEAGEDPLFIARRMVIFAAEDVGNAEPQALQVAVAAKEAVHFVGLPEGRIPLAQAVTFLATCPKSNAAYRALLAATEEVRRTGPLAVPLHLRNAPTPLMKGLGYGAGYLYPHDYENAVVDQEYRPPELADRRYYEPSDRGREQEIAERLRAWRARRAR